MKTQITMISKNINNLYTSEYENITSIKKSLMGEYTQKQVYWYFYSLPPIYLIYNIPAL